MKFRSATPARVLAAIVLAVAAGLSALPTVLAQGDPAGEEDEPVPPKSLAELAGEPPPPAPIHDPSNPDAPRLQKPAEAFAGLPRDRRGRVDWMAALRQGGIAPRADVGGKKPVERFTLDIVMRNTREMPHVKFPHEAHSLWLACENCHRSLFVPRAGANPVNMTEIFQGRWCGECHGKVAFTPMFDCERCHSVPHGQAQAWW